jgi:(p)ppGpp synthase/HD superfamily hydrolase
MAVNISAVQTIKVEGDGAIINLSVEIDGLKQLNRIMKDIQGIKGVKDVGRVKELKH